MPIRCRGPASVAAAAALALILAGCSVQVGGTAAPAPGASTDGAVVVVPLQVVRQQSATLAIVPVTIAGEGPYPFVLDTGASTSGVTQVLAERLRLPETGERTRVSGVTGSGEVPVVRIDRWSVAGTALKPTSVGALPFSMGDAGDTDASTAQIAGLLGSDQLSRFGSITIDYRREQLRFTPGTG